MENSELLDCINRWDIVIGESGDLDMSKYTGNIYRGTSFRDSGRKAGTGIAEDDYSETSGFSGWHRDRSYERVRFPNDDVKPEELNGECVIVQKGKEVDIHERLSQSGHYVGNSRLCR